MARLVAIYATPKDPAAFDGYYFSTHVPLAKTIPGLVRYEVSRGRVMATGRSCGVHLVAAMYFATLADLKAGLASPAGRETARDVARFADGGVELLMIDDHEI
jgi:uncharacterized protein (TIGR02118 family)